MLKLLSNSFIAKYVSNTASACFENLKLYLVENDFSFSSDHVMSICYYDCFKQFAVNFLHDEVYTLGI